MDPNLIEIIKQEQAAWAANPQLLEGDGGAAAADAPDRAAQAGQATGKPKKKAATQ